jgi:predicted nucleic acid-binding protein
VIVADTNVIAYLLINGPFTADAETVLAKDPVWAAPVLWRSELASVLSLYVRTGAVSLAGAEAHIHRAGQLVGPNEFAVEHLEVLRLSSVCGCSTYACEFVWGARSAGVPLVTSDKKLLAAFPNLAFSLQDFAAG